MDGAMTKAPLGGEKTGKNPTDRAKSGTKRSLLTEGHGILIGLSVEEANCHDKKMGEATLDRSAPQSPLLSLPRSPAPGLPRMKFL